jgi:hypothetical protein
MLTPPSDFVCIKDETAETRELPGVDTKNDGTVFGLNGFRSLASLVSFRGPRQTDAFEQIFRQSIS